VIGMPYLDTASLPYQLLWFTLLHLVHKRNEVYGTPIRSPECLLNERKKYNDKPSILKE